MCLLGVEQRTQRDSAITTALALRKLFHVEGELLEKADLFRYLGQILAQDNDDVRAVKNQIKKAQGIWARVGQVLTAEITPPKVSPKFYEAVMQSVLLYGSETWNLSSRGWRGFTFAQPTRWPRNTSRRRDCITGGGARSPLMFYRSAAWPQFHTTLTSGGPGSLDTW